MQNARPACAVFLQFQSTLVFFYKHPIHTKISKCMPNLICICQLSSLEISGLKYTYTCLYASMNKIILTEVYDNENISRLCLRVLGIYVCVQNKSCSKYCSCLVSHRYPTYNYVCIFIQHIYFPPTSMTILCGLLVLKH